MVKHGGNIPGPPRSLYIELACPSLSGCLGSEPDFAARPHLGARVLELHPDLGLLTGRQAQGIGVVPQGGGKPRRRISHHQGISFVHQAVAVVVDLVAQLLDRGIDAGAFQVACHAPEPTLLAEAALTGFTHHIAVVGVGTGTGPPGSPLAVAAAGAALVAAVAAGLLLGLAGGADTLARARAPGSPLAVAAAGAGPGAAVAAAAGLSGSRTTRALLAGGDTRGIDIVHGGRGDLRGKVPRLHAVPRVASLLLHIDRAVGVDRVHPSHMADAAGAALAGVRLANEDRFLAGLGEQREAVARGISVPGVGVGAPRQGHVPVAAGLVPGVPDAVPAQPAPIAADAEVARGAGAGVLDAAALEDRPGRQR
jgi:hypothetical protein